MSYLTSGLNWYIKSKQIDAWNDRYLFAGDTFTPIIKEKMEESDIIILLVSYKFTLSDYIMDYEIPIAVDRFKHGARIIPIILEDCPYAFLNKALGEDINELPRTPDNNVFQPVDKWEKLAWKIITEQLLRIIKNADLNNTAASPQPTQVTPEDQSKKILTNQEQPADADIQHPNHPINNIFSASYTVPGNLLATKNEKQESIYFDEQEKNDITYIFNSILSDDKNSAELQGIITKIRLEDPDKAGIRKKCVVVGALTISLLRKFNRERVLMLIDFIEDKEPGLWERALVGMVLALGDRFKELDGQIKRKLQWLSNDEAIQESITNLFYVLYFRSISAEEMLYKNREGFLNITFFQNQANWFLPFTHADIPEDLIKKNEVFNYADNAIFLKDDNIKFLTFIQYNLLTQEEQTELEDNLHKERELRNNIFGGRQP